MTAADRQVTTRATLFSVGALGYLVPMVLPIMIRDIASDIRIDVPAVGALLGLQSIIVAVASALIGPLSDRWSPQRLIPPLLIINGTALIAFSQSRSIETLYAFGMLSAAAFGPLPFCAFAYVADNIKEESRASFVGIISGSLYACILFGFPVTVLIMEDLQLGWRVALLPFGALSIVCGLIAFHTLRPAPPAASSTQVLNIASAVKTYLGFAGNPALAGLLSIFFIIRFGAGIYLTYCATYLLTARGFPPDGFMWINAAGAALAFLVSLTSSWLVARVGIRSAIALSSASIIVSIFLIVGYPTTRSNIVFWVGFFSAIYMMSEAIRMSSLHMVAITKVDAGSRGAFLACINVLIHLGTAAGALVGGALLVEPGNAPRMSDVFQKMVQITAGLWLLAALLSTIFAFRGDRVTEVREVSP